MRALRDDPAYRPPGGESHDDLVARVVPAWERVVAEGGTSVVVCHRKPILVVLAHLLGLPARPGLAARRGTGLAHRRRGVGRRRGLGRVHQPHLRRAGGGGGRRPTLVA